MSKSQNHQLQKSKWIVLIASVMLASASEVYSYVSGIRDLTQIAIWVVGTLSLVILLTFTFRQVDRLQLQSDERLEQSQSLARQQAALLHLSAQLSSTLDQDKICQIVLDNLRQTLGYQYADIQLIDETRREAIQITAPPGEDVLDKIEDYEADTDQERQKFPLRVSGQLLGYLILGKKPPSESWNQETNLITAIANHAALAIVNARQFQQQSKQRQSAETRELVLRRRERFLSLLNEISQVTLQSQDLVRMLQSLTDRLGSLFAADSVFITLWNALHQQFEPVAAYGPLRHVIRTLQLKPEDLPLASSVLESAQPLVVPDSRNSAHISARMAEAFQSRSLVALPLIAGEQKQGVVVISFQSQHQINRDMLEMAEQIARHIALAIAKDRALQAAQDRAQELTALQKATATLLSTLELEGLLGQILDASISAIPAAKKGRVHLVARETGTLQIRAAQGYQDPRINAVRSTDLSSHPARAVRERRPLLINDMPIASEHRLQAEIPEVRSIVSMIVAPLQRGDEVLGAISLEAFTRNAFTKADLDLLVSFAATATTAIHNAQMHAAVQKEAITDTLTGLYNRRGFFEFGWREVERAHRFAHPLSVVLFDLDNFKQINDRYGHLTGDRVLAGLGALLKRELRQIDLLGRYGGDEFIILLPETDCANAQQAAERLRLASEAISFSVGNHPARVTTSAGVACLQQPTETLEQLIDRADQALYQAKSSGRNRVVA